MLESKRKSDGNVTIVPKIYTFFDCSERRAHGQVAKLVDAGCLINKNVE